MAATYHQLKWSDTMNDVTVDCSLDIAVHPADSNVVLLIVPGVDGSVDGYENKYVRIADSIQSEHGAAVVRMANPFISSFHWQSNVRQALHYLLENAADICGHDDPEIRIMATSAGASVVAQIAWEYPEITRLLLINPATSLGIDVMKRGIAEFGGDKITVIFGSDDPGAADAEQLSTANESPHMQTYVLDGVDHHFSGDAMQQFLTAPHTHLFDRAV